MAPVYEQIVLKEDSTSRSDPCRKTYPQLYIISPTKDDSSIIAQVINNVPAPKKMSAWTPLVERERAGSFYLLSGEDDTVKGKPEVTEFGPKKPTFRDHVWKYAQMYREETCTIIDSEEAEDNNKKLIKACEPVEPPHEP